MSRAVVEKRPREKDEEKDAKTLPLPPPRLRVGFRPSSGSDQIVYQEHQELLEPSRGGPLDVFGSSSASRAHCVSKAFGTGNPEDDCAMELLRHESSGTLYEAINAACTAEGFTATHIYTAFVFETTFEVSRAVARCGVVPTTRDFLLASDIGVVVTTKGPSDAVTGPIVSISKYDKDVGGHTVTISGTSFTARLCECVPVDPIPLYLDAVLPCGEIVDLHHCPTSVRDISLSFLYTKRTDLKSKQKMMRAWAIADEATRLASAARRELRRRWDNRPPPREVPLTVHMVPVSDEHVALQCGGLSHTILRSHLEKLRTLYEGCSHPPEYFLHRSFALLTRYHALAGSTSNAEQEAGWQCAVPPRAMKALQREMGCVAECFASPFNTYMRNYCSAFPDTDGYFGSHGSFFTFEPTHGSFEANPPFNRQVIGEMFKNILKLLQNAVGPMSFVVVLPILVPCSLFGEGMYSFQRH